MKKQCLKLFVATLIIGVFAVSSALAQQNLSFEVPFDFQVGQQKLDAGRYEMRRLDHAKFILKNSETGDSLILVSTAPVGDERNVRTEKLVFNRYGETYFLSEIYPLSGAVGREMTETKAERKVRRKYREMNPQLAENTQPDQISISSAQ